jgi:hypothetical protein
MQESAWCQNFTFWMLLNDVQDFLGKSLHWPAKPCADHLALRTDRLDSIRPQCVAESKHARRGLLR